MKTNDTCTTVRQIPLFSDLSDERCEKISANGQVITSQRGDILPVDHSQDVLYIVLSGELASFKDGPLGEEPIDVVTYTAGHFFAGLHLAFSARVDRVRVIKDSELLLLDRTTLDEIFLTFLRKLSFFQDLKAEALDAIAREVYMESFETGEIVFHQGDPAGALYIVVSGEVVMVRRYEEDDQTIEEEIRNYSRGLSFGERGVLVDQKRAASALVKERASLLVLQAEKFQQLVVQYPEIAINLYRVLADLLEEQSFVSWRAARDAERMKELIQSAKMAALGQLVAGVAHEINTPVGAIYSNSNQLEDILSETLEYYHQLPEVILKFNNENHLDTIAHGMGFDIDDRTRRLVKLYVAQQLDYVHNFYDRADMMGLFDDMQEISEELSEAAVRIRDMVLSLSNFARVDQAELKKVDVHEGIASTLSLLHHELKYSVIVERNFGDLPEITCYPNQLNQVFMNILMNAIQALELDKLEEGKKGLIQIETYRENEWIVIAFKDSGKGIPPEHMDRIFEPFFSTKGAAAAAGGLGLGLGLSISRKIIEEKHLGKIEVNSQVGEGTTFFIKLPLERPLPISTMQTAQQ
jgi:signal transduction histidine kinase